jgi:SAM-dependent methyltransferase
MEKDGADILSGSLLCGQCRTEYPVKDGIAYLLPRSFPKYSENPSKYESPFLISAYLWSHYADLSEDMDANTAYEEWAKLLEYNPGVSLDAGCAVGRFAFEMSNKSDFVVGIDNSQSFIREARHLMINRQLRFSQPIEGNLVENRVIELPNAWSANRLEFLVGDAQSLPFRSNSFSSIASLNLVDKIPGPLAHLKEMDRVALEEKVQFLFSDPFSWSSEIAREEEWLGGTNKGPYGGRAFDNIIKILSGKGPEYLLPWQIEKQGHVWWKIRNHRNHYELIRSCFIKARR